MSETLEHQSSERELALSAQARRQAFHRDIEAKAAELRAPRPIAPAPVRALCPSEFYKECWFQIIGISASEKLSMVQIKKAVSDHYGVSVEDIVSARRQKYIIIPRQVAVYLCKQLTPSTLPMIGRAFGGRDHTTALSSVRRIEALLPTMPELAASVAEIRSKLEALL